MGCEKYVLQSSPGRFPSHASRDIKLIRGAKGAGARVYTEAERLSTRSSVMLFPEGTRRPPVNLESSRMVHSRSQLKLKRRLSR